MTVRDACEIRFRGRVGILWVRPFRKTEVDWLSYVLSSWYLPMNDCQKSKISALCIVTAPGKAGVQTNAATIGGCRLNSSLYYVVWK